MGCDYGLSLTSHFPTPFQSTHPVWGATGFPRRCWTSRRFQSTHPVWGATVDVVSGTCLVGISIHAPRVGCDSKSVAARNLHEISIHAPRVGCDGILSQGSAIVGISIHAPRVGCDLAALVLLGEHTRISIHAPRVGCDVGLALGLQLIGVDFNPRTPCGVRRTSSLHRLEVDDDFNPRTPWGVRQAVRTVPVATMGFQSTHPVWGATVRVDACKVRHILFQSTHPVWGATAHHGHTVQHLRYFNPRTPCGVRPGGAVPAHAGQRISIHAPRVGCDRMNGSDTQTLSGFQSTHPVWGATCEHCHTARFQTNFNPRTPCGVRPPGQGQYSGVWKISIHAPRVGCDISAHPFH